MHGSGGQGAVHRPFLWHSANWLQATGPFCSLCFRMSTVCSAQHHVRGTRKIGTGRGKGRNEAPGSPRGLGDGASEAVHSGAVPEKGVLGHRAGTEQQKPLFICYPRRTNGESEGLGKEVTHFRSPMRDRCVWTLRLQRLPPPAVPHPPPPRSLPP